MEVNAKELNCVYTKDIASPCPIRIILSSSKDKDKLEKEFSKYIEPSLPKELQQMIQGMYGEIEKFFSKELSELSSFCYHCPARILYIEKCKVVQ
jgi:hypothetical protein